MIWNKKEQGFHAAAGQVRGLLKRMRDYAMTCGLINHNPVSALPMRHVHKAVERDRAPNTAEVQAFLRGVRSSNVRRQIKLAFHLILASLVRKSELMLAQWKDVHFDSAEWHVPKENSKTGKPRRVPLETSTRAIQGSAFIGS